MFANKIKRGQACIDAHAHHFKTSNTFYKCTVTFRTPCIGTQSVPRCKHCPPRLYKTKLLMLCKAKVAVCSDIRTKHSTQSEQRVEFFNFQPVALELDI